MILLFCDNLKCIQSRFLTILHSQSSHQLSYKHVNKSTYVLICKPVILTIWALEYFKHLKSVSVKGIKALFLIKNQLKLCKTFQNWYPLHLMALAICSSIGEVKVTSNDVMSCLKWRHFLVTLTICLSLLLTSGILVLSISRSDVTRNDEQMVSH